MSDQINDVLAFVTHNISVSATSTTFSDPIDVSGFELGLSVAWQVTGITGSSVSDIEIIEGDTSSGSFSAIDPSRFIFSELFVKEFGNTNILRLQSAVSANELVSYFGVRDTKKFIKVQIFTAVTMPGTTNILANIFLHTESSPVRKNQVGFTFLEPGVP